MLSRLTQALGTLTSLSWGMAIIALVIALFVYFSFVGRVDRLSDEMNRDLREVVPKKQSFSPDSPKLVPIAPPETPADAMI